MLSWSSSKDYKLEYLSLSKTLRAEIFPEDSFYVAHDDGKVANSVVVFFALFERQRPCSRALCPRECGPLSANHVSSTDNPDIIFLG